MQKDTMQIKVCMNQSLHKTINLRSPIRVVRERRMTVLGRGGHWLRLPRRHLVWHGLMARSMQTSHRFWSACSSSSELSWSIRNLIWFPGQWAFPVAYVSRRTLVPCACKNRVLANRNISLVFSTLMLKTERADERNEILSQRWTSASGMSLGSVCMWWTGNWPLHFTAAWVVWWLCPCLLVWRSSSCLQNSKISMLKQWRKCFHLETNFHPHCDWFCNVIVSQ